MGPIQCGFCDERLCTVSCFCLFGANQCGFCDERCARSHACSVPAHVLLRLSEKYGLHKKKPFSPWRFSVPELELDLSRAANSSLPEVRLGLEKLLARRRAGSPPLKTKRKKEEKETDEKKRKEVDKEKQDGKETKKELTFDSSSSTSSSSSGSSCDRGSSGSGSTSCGSAPAVTEGPLPAYDFARKRCPLCSKCFSSAVQWEKSLVKHINYEHGTLDANDPHLKSWLEAFNRVLSYLVVSPSASGKPTSAPVPQRI